MNRSCSPSYRFSPHTTLCYTSRFLLASGALLGHEPGCRLLKLSFPLYNSNDPPLLW